MLNPLARFASFAAVGGLALSLCACGSKPAAENPSATPGTTPAVDKTSAPAASAAAPVMSTSGTVTTVTGNEDQVSGTFKLDAGTYLFSWTSPGAFVGVELQDGNGETVEVLSIGGPTGQELCSIESAKAGNYKVAMSSTSTWTLKIEKVDGSRPEALPQTLAGEESKAATSKPFKLEPGAVTVSWTYKAEPRGTGTIRILNVATGDRLTTNLMSAGNTSGSFEVQVPAAGTYIAKTIFPAGSSGGEVKITR